ncbi:MarR family winged helix-turn-helix transcriptional regulator [Deinococcus cellulosilyticus]|uniref:MarR family transcriptional regulator n=1 Tax=Deinococcus cellulosilyticus (strain DSM 18568 / NBRC 106333 / KACC 11606 / 5516J-15) TaxID=1223518 RepID=A0A511N4B2_DEIC1|nr:MarR family transcriptional regulator [Deinococcus cellulosilyticus]GEM47308.1 MarR family transcriptional regulator [Deinococcus cellulosilyticus NBRC 106333 = KACC 11606]
MSADAASPPEVPRTPAAETFSQVVVQIFRLHGLIGEAGEKITRPTGQSTARWQVLGAMGEEGSSVATIARRMGLTRQSVQRVADVLEQEGLAEYQDNPCHKRAKLLVLTDQGKAVLQQIEAAQIQWANEVAKDLDVDALKTLGHLLVQLEKRLLCCSVQQE